MQQLVVKLKGYTVIETVKSIYNEAGFETYQIPFGIYVELKYNGESLEDELNGETLTFTRKQVQDLLRVVDNFRSYYLNEIRVITVMFGSFYLGGYFGRTSGR